MLRGNLSTRPFYNDRAVTLVIVAVTLLVAALTAYNVTRLVSLSGRRGAIQGRIAASRNEALQTRTQAAAVQQGIDRSSLAQLAASAREANQLIDDRTFSWTALFALLEKAMPMDVRLVAVVPRLEKGTRVVTLTVAARTLRDVDDLTDALAATGAFHNPVAVENQSRDDGTYTAKIEGGYEPLSAPTAGAVEKAPPAPQPKTLLPAGGPS